MMSYIKSKYLIVAALLLPMFSLSAVIDENLWSGVEDAFARITEADAYFRAGKPIFIQLQSDYSSLLLNFGVYEAQRQAAFSCIRTSITDLESRLDTAIAYKTLVEHNASVEQAALRAQITQTRAERTAIINGLISAKEALQTEIDTLQTDLATLASMSTTKVDQALVDLNAGLESYWAMIAERETFMTILDNVLTRAQAFEATQESEIASMGSFCNE